MKTIPIYCVSTFEPTKVRLLSFKAIVPEYEVVEGCLQVSVWGISGSKTSEEKFFLFGDENEFIFKGPHDVTFTFIPLIKELDNRLAAWEVKDKTGELALVDEEGNCALSFLFKEYNHILKLGVDFPIVLQ